ncbi:MAG: PQQ-binding-like beta-propeller repeat protein [Planctomycetes bacterium]|nr:PQQ-binding-like beta-propeller repeat protein [Planctomycetota bacterium]
MSHRLIFVSTCVCLFAASLARGEDWTEFRGRSGQGHSVATGLPTTWSETENVAWKQEIPGHGWSSPIILGDHLYLTTAVPEGDGDKPAQSLRTLCLDKRTGAIRWNVEVFKQPEGIAIHGKNSHASPTPITDGKRLVVHFGTHGTACLALADGKVLWQNQELKYAPVHGNGGSPVLVGGLVIVCCDGGDQQFVAALDFETGSLRWKTPRSTKPKLGFSFATPLLIDVDGVPQVVCQASDAVLAYSPADGKELWKVDYPGGYSVVPRPVFGNGLLFVCTGYNTPMVLAIRPQGAVGDVTETHVAWKLTKGAPHNPSPLLVGTSLYLVSDKGIATCVDAATGDQIWQERLGGEFSASPLFADGKIYLQNEAGDGIVLKPGDQFVELARNALKEKSLASYAVEDGTLFIRVERHLYRIQNP